MSPRLVAVTELALPIPESRSVAKPKRRIRRANSSRESDIRGLEAAIGEASPQEVLGLFVGQAEEVGVGYGVHGAVREKVPGKGRLLHQIHFDHRPVGSRFPQDHLSSPRPARKVPAK